MIVPDISSALNGKRQALINSQESYARYPLVPGAR